MLGGGSGLGKKLVDNLCKNNTVYALINKSRIKERKNLFTFKLDLSNKKSIDTFFLKNFSISLFVFFGGKFIEIIIRINIFCFLFKSLFITNTCL